MYRYLYRLKLEVLYLTETLYIYIDSKFDLEILSKVNTLIFVRKLKYDKYYGNLVHRSD